ncbi:MAG TPA: pitrilysin family protein [Polyangia bacterium]|jgi:predicted Zn-dependent peptidase|nr:pitrilysin family protein [Polyangia bacterium]
MSSGHLSSQPDTRTPVLAKAPYRVARSLLPNGLRLVTVETPHLHTAVLSLFVRAGSRYETPKTNGLSHFVEHMLFRGCAQFPDSFALNLGIEDLGGTLYAETGRDYSLYQVPLHAPHLPRGLEILGDLFSTPSFRDIDLERQIILEEILEDLDDEGRNINLDDLSRSAVWQKHPLGYTITGPLRNVRRFKVEDVRDHFRRFYGAANMVLCVAGPLRHAAVESTARAAFARVPRGRRCRPVAPRASLNGPRFRSIHNESAQTQVHVLFHALAERDPDYQALRALMRVLDDGMSTRLHYQICDQKGLAYSVAGSLFSYHDAALLEIDAACAHAKLPDLVAESLAILARFRTELVSEQELGKAKRRFLGDLEACYDDLDSLCSWFGGTELFYRPHSQERKIREVERVRPEHILRAARRVIRPERLNVVVVGALGRPIARKVAAIVKGFR